MYLLLLLSFGLSTAALAQQPHKLGKLTSSKLDEVSGIIPYAFKPGYFWVHNDSGDDASIYLIDSTANLKLTVSLEGVNVVDCEDIARVDIRGESYLVLADMGNNSGKRDTLSLYLFKEPRYEGNEVDIQVKRAAIQQLRFRYKDHKRDAEALFVDPKDLTVYIISKRDFKSTVFSFPLVPLTDTVQELEPLLQLPFTFTTAADITTDGRYILIKNLKSIFMWERKSGAGIITTLKQPFKEIPYEIEPQGEAICFDLTERYFYTISERPLGLDAYLYRYDY